MSNSSKDTKNKDTEKDTLAANLARAKGVVGYYLIVVDDDGEPILPVPDYISGPYKTRELAQAAAASEMSTYSSDYGGTACVLVEVTALEFIQEKTVTESTSMVKAPANRKKRV